MGDFTPRYCCYRIVSTNKDWNENSFPSFLQHQNHGNVCYPRSSYTCIPNRIYFLLNTFKIYNCTLNIWQVMRMPWKVFGQYAVWKLKVNKINCMTWNSLKSWFRPLGVRFFSVCMFFNLSLSVNNKLVNNTLVNHLEKWVFFFWFPVWFWVVSINCRSSDSSIW